MKLEGVVGPASTGDGAPYPLRLGKNAEIPGLLHGRYYEQNYRGNVFSGGMTLTSISNVTFTTGTLGATCTPILGLYNPLSSLVNAVLIHAALQVVITALQNTGGGPFVWATATGQSALTLGTVPLNRKTLTQAGSQVKDMSGIALTGLVGSLVVRAAGGLAGGNVHNIASLDTAAGYPTLLGATVDNFDGLWIIPPGGLIALLATTTPVAHSAASGFTWEEVPV
jgi:hypothetical protein